MKTLLMLALTLVFIFSACDQLEYSDLTDQHDLLLGKDIDNLLNEDEFDLPIIYGRIVGRDETKCASGAKCMVPVEGAEICAMPALYSEPEPIILDTEMVYIEPECTKSLEGGYFKLALKRNGLFILTARAKGYNPFKKEIKVERSSKLLIELNQKQTNRVSGVVTEAFLDGVTSAVSLDAGSPEQIYPPNGISGAEVCLSSFSSDLTNSKLCTKTNERGNFSFKEVRYGEYTLSAQHENYKSHKRVVKITADEYFIISLIKEMVEEFVLTGQVFEDSKVSILSHPRSSKPISGALVCIFDATQTIDYPGRKNCDLTNKDGVYVIKGIERGNYGLMARKKSYKLFNSEIKIFSDTKRNIFIKRLAQAQSTIKGIVFKADINTVLDYQIATKNNGSINPEPPLGGVKVCLEKLYTINNTVYFQDSSGIGIGAYCTVSKADGSFSMKNISSGHYMLQAYKDGFQNFKRGIKINGDREVKIPMHKKIKQENRLEGTVFESFDKTTSANGFSRPIEGAEVCVRVKPNHILPIDCSECLLPPTILQCTRSNEKGHFVLEGLHSEMYLITAQKCGFKTFKDYAMIEGKRLMNIQLVRDGSNFECKVADYIHYNVNWDIK